jgi:hypothetical protein
MHSCLMLHVPMVKRGMMLRTLGFDARRDGVAHLTSLQHPTQLGIWNASYDDDGWCSDARCAAGLHAAMGGSAPVVSDDSIADDGLNDDDYAEPMHL